MESNGQTLGEECCFRGVFRDNGVSAQWPCRARASCLHDKWVENVGAGQFAVPVNLVLCCLIGCCTWFGCCAVRVGLRFMYR